MTDWGTPPNPDAMPMSTSATINMPTDATCPVSTTMTAMATIDGSRTFFRPTRSVRVPAANSTANSATDSTANTRPISSVDRWKESCANSDSSVEITPAENQKYAAFDTRTVTN